MEKINGYVIIAHRPYRNQMPAEGFTILGAKKNRYNKSGFEYVTAVVGTLDDRDWSWGHYHSTIDAALLDFNVR
jgi:hypothetical protein